MNLDNKLHELPLSKSNPEGLKSLFGTTDIVPMWVADMEFEIAQPIQDALVKRVKGSGFGYEYRPQFYFDAQQRWYLSSYNIDLNKMHVAHSPGIATSLAFLIEGFSAEGDGVIIQPPVFMEFKEVVKHTNRKLVKNPLKLVDGHYEMDFENLKERAKEAKALILCNPHNPVGRVWKKEELKEIVRICKENNVLLISDEIHKDIVLFGNSFTSVLEFAPDYENMVVCTSEAKTFNLCGISDSLIITPGEDISKMVKSVYGKYKLGRTNALTRVALEAAYNYGRPWLDEALKTIGQNVSDIEQELKGSKIGLIKPEGTYQVWLDFSNIFSDTQTMFEHVTQHSGIGMNAGHWFGREGALFMRMNIATSHKKVMDAIRRVKGAVSGL